MDWTRCFIFHGGSDNTDYYIRSNIGGNLPSVPWRERPPRSPGKGRTFIVKFHRFQHVREANRVPERTGGA